MRPDDEIPEPSPVEFIIKQHEEACVDKEKDLFKHLSIAQDNFYAYVKALRFCYRQMVFMGVHRATLDKVLLDILEKRER